MLRSFLSAFSSPARSLKTGALLAALGLLAGCGISTLSSMSDGAGDNTYGGPDEADGGYESDGAGGSTGANNDAGTLRGNPLCNANADGTSCFPDEAPTAALCGAKPAPIVDAGGLLDASSADGGGGQATSGAACHVRATDDAGASAPSCLPAGSGHNGDECLKPADCAAGFECVGSPGQCRPYCCSGTCHTDSFCDIQPVADVGAVRVPVCEPVKSCKLLSSMGCADGETCAIVNDDDGTTSCVTVGTAQVGQACEITHCAADLTCLGQPGSRKCYKLCSKSNTAYGCPTDEQCKGSAPLFKDSTVGVCQKP